MSNLDAREPGLTRIGDWRCGDTGIVRYAEHIAHPEWRVSIANGGALCSQYGGVEVPPAVFAWLIKPIVDAARNEGPEHHDEPPPPSDDYPGKW